jgi:hypothetical protein
MNAAELMIRQDYSGQATGGEPADVAVCGESFWHVAIETPRRLVRQVNQFGRLATSHSRMPETPRRLVRQVNEFGWLRVTAQRVLSVSTYPLPFGHAPLQFAENGGLPDSLPPWNSM